jgi:hypothetical protein
MTGPDAVDHVTGMLPEVMVATVRQLIEQSRSLGMTWTLRLATVITTNPVRIVFDGDVETNLSPAVPMISEINAQQRVYVLIIPPAGNFICGSASILVVPSRLGNTIARTFTTVAGTTTSATPVAMAGPPTCSIVKAYGKNVTRFKFTWAGTFFGAGGDAGAAFYARDPSSGNIVQLAQMNAANGTNGVRQALAGITYSVAGQDDARTYSFEGYWARTGGVGTLTVAADDEWCLAVEEILIQQP